MMSLSLYKYFTQSTFILVVILISGLFLSCSNAKTNNENRLVQPRIHGFNLVAPREVFSLDSLQKLKDTGAKWVAVVPYAFCNSVTGEIIFDHERQWWGEKPEGVSETIKMAHSLNLKVMLKPHLWVGGQGWAGDLEFENDSLWSFFEKQYSDYLMVYAQIADSLNVEMLCIGTEIRKSTSQRPNYWYKLIEDTKHNYKGLLTYAANWDEYDQIKFWNDLDYIGIDAYFPLSSEKNPKKSKLIKAWKQPIEEMKKISLQYNKPVLFTEYGFESIDYPTIGHWKVSKDTLSINFEAQKTAFESTYEALAGEKWWAGGLIWKWHLTQNGLQKRTKKAYTAQDKPALESIKNEFNQKQ